MTWFVHRNPDTSIAMISRTNQPGYNDEQLADNDPAIIAFTAVTAAQSALAQLQTTQAQMEQLFEALVDVLLAKNVTAGVPLIAAADFRADIRALYVARKALRVTAGLP